MKNVNLKIISDTLFAFFSCFILFFVLANFFINRVFSIIFSLSLSTIISLFLFAFMKNKNINSNLKKQEKLLMEKTFLSMFFLPYDKILSLFENAFLNQDISTIKNKHGLFLPSCNTFCIFRFGVEGVTKSDVVFLFNLSEFQYCSLRIYCNDCDKEISSFAQKFDRKIEFIAKEQSFLLLKKGNSLPEVSCNLKNAKRVNFSFNNVFDRKKSVKTFLYGTVFLLLSIFSIYKLYYLIFGSVLMIFSVFCRFLGKEKG